MALVGLRRYAKGRTRVSEEEKIFFARRERKHSSCGAWGRRGIGVGAAAWILSWPGYKYEVGGGGAMSLGFEGWGA